MSERPFWHEDPDAPAGDNLPAPEAGGDRYELVPVNRSKTAAEYDDLDVAAHTATLMEFVSVVRDIAARLDTGGPDFQQSPTGALIGAWLAEATETLQIAGELPTIETLTKDTYYQYEDAYYQYFDRFISLLEQARGSFREAITAAPNFSPAFTDGYGRVHNDLISAGVRLALVAANWNGSKTAYPEFSFANGAGQAVYAPSERTYPSAADAWKAVEQYGDAHCDLFDYILAKMLASKASNQRDIYGDFRLTPEEVLEARGIKKHKNGGYRPEDMREVIEQVRHLAGIDVRASVSGYTKLGKGRRGKRQTLTLEHAIPLITINERLDKVSLNGERVPVAWQLRPGNWARELEQFTPQYAWMMQGILQLHAHHDANAKRIGRFLVYQYRVREHERSWAQPYRVADLLSGAGIEVDRAHAGRFRERIEAALDVLANPVLMDGPVCIQSWRYVRPVAATGRGWLDAWLGTGIIIMPSDDIMNRRALMKRVVQSIEQ